MEWDKHWARQIEFVYNGSRDFVNEVLVAGQIDQEAESLLSTHREKIRDLCLLQHRFSQSASEMLVAENLESRWLSISAPSRRTHLLEGIVRTCRMDGIEQQRLFANEVTVSNMERNGGITAFSARCASSGMVRDSGTELIVLAYVLTPERFRRKAAVQRRIGSMSIYMPAASKSKFGYHRAAPLRPRRRPTPPPPPLGPLDRWIMRQETRSNATLHAGFMELKEDEVLCTLEKIRVEGEDDDGVFKDPDTLKLVMTLKVPSDLMAFPVTLSRTSPPVTLATFWNDGEQDYAPYWARQPRSILMFRHDRAKMEQLQQVIRWAHAASIGTQVGAAQLGLATPRKRSYLMVCPPRPERNQLLEHVRREESPTPERRRWPVKSNT
ncbi:hypothetical protein PLICRDRAFT_26572 [Plicaturopsis crispa FD-325 SS-3]|nr:hypothetical protein PLICRDRAFT_26572 [Plicaturopsis crispa FD-325 SS-3]